MRRTAAIEGGGFPSGARRSQCDDGRDCRINPTSRRSFPPCSHSIVFELANKFILGDLAPYRARATVQERHAFVMARSVRPRGFLTAKEMRDSDLMWCRAESDI